MCLAWLLLLQTLPEREARAIIAQVFAGLAHLNRGDEAAADHSGPRVIHYDLKPANILFDSLGTVKITDFGLSKVCRVAAGPGAPWMLHASEGACAPVDVWWWKLQIPSTACKQATIVIIISPFAATCLVAVTCPTPVPV